MQNIHFLRLQSVNFKIWIILKALFLERYLLWSFISCTLRESSKLNNNTCISLYSMQLTSSSVTPRRTWWVWQTLHIEYPPSIASGRNWPFYRQLGRLGERIRALMPRQVARRIATCIIQRVCSTANMTIWKRSHWRITRLYYTWLYYTRLYYTRLYYTWLYYTWLYYTRLYYTRLYYKTVL